MKSILLLLVLWLICCFVSFCQIKEERFWEIDTVASVLHFHKEGEVLCYNYDNIYDRRYWTFYSDKYNILKFDAGIDSIGCFLFHSCSNLRKVDFPVGLKKIGDFAFEGCSRLDSVILYEGLLEIGEGAFSLCNNLDYVTLPSSVKRIGIAAFSRTSLKSIVMPKSTKIIEESLFLMCFNLKNVVLHENIELINDMAFSDCLELEEIDIPKSVFRLGKDFLHGCNSLKSIKFNHIDLCMFHIDKDAFRGLNTSKIIVHVPYGCRNIYERILNEYCRCSFKIIEED